MGRQPGWYCPLSCVRVALRKRCCQHRVLAQLLAPLRLQNEFAEESLAYCEGGFVKRQVSCSVTVNATEGVNCEESWPVISAGSNLHVYLPSGCLDENLQGFAKHFGRALSAGQRQFWTLETSHYLYNFASEIVGERQLPQALLLPRAAVLLQDRPLALPLALEQRLPLAQLE